MKKSLIYILFTLVIACKSSDDNRADIIKLMIDEVSYLSSDELEGRETGTEGEMKAAEYISSKFLISTLFHIMEAWNIGKTVIILLVISYRSILAYSITLFS